jgi:hypothetical protein
MAQYDTVLCGTSMLNKIIPFFVETSGVNAQWRISLKVCEIHLMALESVLRHALAPLCCLGQLRSRWCPAAWAGAVGGAGAR